MAKPRRLRLRELVLLPSWHCDIACHHCLFSSSPRVQGQLPLALARAAIRAAAAHTSAQRVIVSGGEPFLDVPYLLALARAARRAGLGFRVVTNGSFAQDVASARTHLLALQRAGLESLTISWDGFHEAFLPASRIRALLRLCRALDLPVLLSAIVTRSRTLADALAPLGEDAIGVPLLQSACLPVGRAARKLPARELLPVAAADIGRACARDFDSASITHDGAVYPCSAVGGFTPGLRLGNLHEAPLDVILARRAREWIFLALANRGPTALLAHATPKERASIGLDPAAHDCVNCHRMFSAPLGAVLVQRLREQLSAQAARTFDLSEWSN